MAETTYNELSRNMMLLTTPTYPIPSPPLSSPPPSSPDKPVQCPPIKHYWTVDLDLDSSLSFRFLIDQRDLCMPSLAVIVELEMLFLLEILHHPQLGY